MNWLDAGEKLEEGASTFVRIPQDSMLEPFVAQWKKIYASAGDATGREYKSKSGEERPVIVPGVDWETAKRLQEIKWPVDARQLPPKSISTAPWYRRLPLVRSKRHD